jgi:hypothetical protein
MELRHQVGNISATYSEALRSNLRPQTVKTEIYHRFPQPLKQKFSTVSRIIPRQYSFHLIAQQCELLTVLSNKPYLFTGTDLLTNKRLTELQRYEQTCPWVQLLYKFISHSPSHKAIKP